MPAPKLPLVVPPATAVAHAAACFASPCARLRFRAHDEPHCFYIDVHTPGVAAPRSYLVFASPTPSGSRLEFRDLGDAASVVAALFVIGLAAATWHTFGFLSLLLALPCAVLLRVAAESAAGAAEQDEVFAALVSAFDPLRPPGSPYRAVRPPSRPVGTQA